MSNAYAFVKTLLGAITTVGTFSVLGKLELLGNKLSRKLMHVCTGLVFMRFWRYFDDSFSARFVCASVPALATLHFLSVGLGYINDAALVAGATRTGNPKELLRGPLLYGVVISILTMLSWRSSPGGMMAIAILCAGDGLADIVGRRLGYVKLPWNRDKSWAGSLACAIGGFVAAQHVIQGFQKAGYMTAGSALSKGTWTANTAACALVGAIVESLPITDYDNLTMSVAVWLTSWYLFGF